MADDRGNNGAGNDVVELEAMRKDSYSWHPCQVSLCSKGLGVILQYKDNYLEEMIADKGEILARIRVRSTPLQGDDCSSLRQGDHVLATKNSHVKSLFHDARVEEAIRVRHSKRTHCRCSFTVKWLDRPLEEALTVPASAIMKLATQSISLHPIISTIFTMLESSNGLGRSPYSIIVDTMSLEMDVSALLDKQIMKISNSTDVSPKKISKDFSFGLQVDLKGQSNGWVIDAASKDPCVTIPLLNNLNGHTGSEDKQPVQTAIGILPDSLPSIQQEFKGSRLPLNPLAARAALASLRSNFPQSADLSILSDVEKGDIKSTLGSRSPNFTKIVKTLFPTPSSPQIVEFPNVSPRAQGNDTEKENKISEKKIIQPSGTRVIRAQLKRSNGTHEHNQMTDTKETHLRSTNTQKVSRSTVTGAGKIEVSEHNAKFEENLKSECIKIDASAKDTIAPEIFLSDERKLVASPTYGQTIICSAEDYKSLSAQDGMIVRVNSQKRTFAEDAEKYNYPKRLTRSAAREETMKNNVQPKLKRGKDKFSESNEVDSFKAHVSAESNSVKTTPNIEETVIGSTEGIISRQSASPRKQETRSSHRLNTRPRTRSQNKV